MRAASFPHHTPAGGGSASVRPLAARARRAARRALPWMLAGWFVFFLPATGMAAEAAPGALSGSVVIHPAPTAASPKSAPSKKPAPPKRTPPPKAPHGDARDLGDAMGKNVWFLQNGPRTPDDGVLTRGVSGHTLTKKRTMQNPVPSGEGQQRQGVDTHQSIDTALKDLAEYERVTPQEDAASDGGQPHKKGITGKVRTESSPWRNPVTEPVRVDQDVAVSRRNVVGAYAHVVDDDNLHVTVGPELSIDTEAGNKGHVASPHQSDPSTLGLGMKFQWDF